MKPRNSLTATHKRLRYERSKSLLSFQNKMHHVEERLTDLLALNDALRELNHVQEEDDALGYLAWLCRLVLPHGLGRLWMFEGDDKRLIQEWPQAPDQVPWDADVGNWLPLEPPHLVAHRPKTRESLVVWPEEGFGDQQVVSLDLGSQTYWAYAMDCPSAENDVFLRLELLCEPSDVGQERLQELHFDVFLPFVRTLQIVWNNHRLQKRLTEMSVRDGLTNLFNRRYFQETLEREVHHAMRSRMPLGLMMVDVDFFKSVNDTAGHEAGDRILQQVAHQIDRCVRASDVPCRFGGEEFVVVLLDISRENLLAKAEEMRLSIAKTIVRHDSTALTVSIGCSHFEREHLTGVELLHRADQALYLAKNRGRNRVEFWEMGLEAEVH
jgi:diguanylate cyclase (GGDEF)-like protein